MFDGATIMLVNFARVRQRHPAQQGGDTADDFLNMSAVHGLMYRMKEEQGLVSDAHPGLVRALGEVFRGAAWQRRAVRLMHDRMRGGGPGSSSAAWTGSSRRCSAGATPPPWPPCTMQRATCWRGFVRGRRRAGGGRAGCPGVHRLPSVALEAPAHESIQRSCNIRLPF